jgi:glycosyltransferase involved in cell wall biosynthesis
VKVLHLSTFDQIGGAGRAARRIHEALLSIGVDSKFVALKSSDLKPQVIIYKRSFLNRASNYLLNKLSNIRKFIWHTNNKSHHTFGISSAGMVPYINNHDADVVHLHWISGMLSIKDIAAIRKPVVWTFHDMWPICGAEHVLSLEDVPRYNYKYSIVSRANDEVGPDLNRIIWQLKNKYWKNTQFSIASPSRWLAELVKQSEIFKQSKVEAIPNPIDELSIWADLDQIQSRIKLNLPLEKKLILFSAVGGLADWNKGGDYLREVFVKLTNYSEAANIELMILGQKTDNEIWPLNVHWFGHIQDESLLPEIYSSADLVIVPSRQDNYPNTVLEAQIMGVPVLAFNVGGISDMFDHKISGWLAEPYEVEDMVRGILWWLVDGFDKNTRKKIRDIASYKFGSRIIASQYLEIYKNISIGYDSQE